jgi:hypothetical protein
MINKHQYLYYNIHFNFINFIVITNNFIICIFLNHLQNNINEFITEINIIKNYFQKPILGIYITFFKISVNEEKSINDENKKKYNMIINIYNFNINKLSQLFMNLLYEYNIYCYDDMGDTFMITQ